MQINPEPTDAELVARANGGDARAFEALYRRHRDWAARVAYRFVGDRQLTQDVVQEVFTWLARKFPGFELRARMTTILYPALKHTAITILQKRRRETGTPLPAAELEAPVENGEGELAAVLSALSPPHREVILLRFVDGLSVEEIAAALGIPEGTVKSRLHHAISDLRADPRVERYFRP